MGLTMEKQYAEYFSNNSNDFQEKLLSEAGNVREKIEEILLVGNIDLLNNAHKLVMYSIGEQNVSLNEFARMEGVSWAKHNLTLAFKLEWVQAIRRTVWYFLERFDVDSENKPSHENFFELERQVNDRIDQFLNGFFLSYSKFKDDLIKSQQAMVEDLSVPIIPISPKVCVLPLIGKIDLFRSNTIEEKALMEIARLRIQTLVMDLSGIAQMETEVIHHMMRTIDGANMMGCECVITGLRPEIVRTITKLGLTFENKAETKATLQQALEDYLTPTVS
ncbi:anti-anti-sigma factor [Bacillus canaveralius]|uniref:Anti-anti-sigma factor n=1 Tax=Bacillus canaveralius TaxID=1403243 RepID=A0A2N5GMY2_9BACI|nr:STAS domain-containing protein [Bacillus canaveralius]PLR83467.1 anti-anti-sigma factor [Bacillus canaveralius]PLR95352.1 anti-anti-sigma factor [Bacillus canaveralius]RSK57076.1 STAS domain-containing protein [Bacillus canaveralius]